MGGGSAAKVRPSSQPSSAPREAWASPRVSGAVPQPDPEMCVQGAREGLALQPPACCAAGASPCPQPECPLQSRGGADGPAAKPAQLLARPTPVRCPAFQGRGPQSAAQFCLLSPCGLSELPGRFRATLDPGPSLLPSVTLPRHGLGHEILAWSGTAPSQLLPLKSSGLQLPSPWKLSRLPLSVLSVGAPSTPGHD